MTEPSVQTTNSLTVPPNPPLEDHRFEISVGLIQEFNWGKIFVVEGSAGKDSARNFAKDRALPLCLEAFDKQVAKVRAMLAEKLEVR